MPGWTPHINPQALLFVLLVKNCYVVKNCPPMPKVRMVLPQEQIACFYCSLNCHISFGKKLSYTWNLWMDVFLCVNRSKADVRQIPYLYCQMEERHWLNNVPSCLLNSCQLVAHRTLAIKNFHSLIPCFRRNPLLFLFSWSFFWNHLLSFHLCPSQIVIILQTSNISP